MTAQRLQTVRVEKPWGRRDLWPGFANPQPGGEPVGEIWFMPPEGDAAELLVKYLFTSERLSIQVHPDDATARAGGYPRGKEEAWLILAAEPDSTIALGTKRPMSRAELRQAAQDGSIEQEMDWKPVTAGDFIYSKAGTVHAIGAGITLIEVQQNVDLTYRLYDYGRPRELHLDAGIAVSNPVPFGKISPASEQGVLCAGRKFVLERWVGAGTHSRAFPADRPALLVPVAGAGSVDGQPWHAGECWEVTGDVLMTLDEGADVLMAYPGDGVAATSRPF